MRRKAKVDSNQADVVAAFRKCGFSVLHLHMVGKGCPDLAIARNGVNTFVEVKYGEAAPSKRRLTPDEHRFFNTWPGPVVIVESVDDVLRLAEELP